jgi:transcriptional regulator with XRE-family HTH domain
MSRPNISPFVQFIVFLLIRLVDNREGKILNTPMTIDKAEIGRRIREVRRRLNMTQRKFGEILGVVPSAVSAYEAGSKFPPPESLACIAEIGGVTFDWLLAGKNPPGPNTTSRLESPSAQSREYPVAGGGESRVAEFPGSFAADEATPLSAPEQRLLQQFRQLPAARQGKLIEDIELINLGLQRRTHCRDKE